MKKSLIALAVVGAFSAPAFADTTLYGTLDAGLVNISNSNEKSQTLVVSGGLTPSIIGIKGAEDLGNGLKAVYKAEFNLDTADNTSIGGSATNPARNKYVGLSGDFGTAVAGFLETAAFDFEVKYDPTAGSKISAFQNIAQGGGFLLQDVGGLAYGQRALAYVSPELSGFKVAVNYITAVSGLGNLGLASGSADVNVTGDIVSAIYDNGPASVGLIYGKENNQAPAAASPSAWQLGGSYDFGVAKLLGTYQSQNNDISGSSNDKMWSLSGVIPAGPGSVVLTYAKSNINSVASANGTSYDAAYVYSLSKTLSLYGAYVHASNDTNGVYSVDNSASALTANQGTGASSNMVALGISKKF